MCIWYLEPFYKLKTEMYSVTERHEKLNSNMYIWCLEAMNKLNTEMYIWCLEPLVLNKLNTKM